MAPTVEGLLSCDFATMTLSSFLGLADALQLAITHRLMIVTLNLDFVRIACRELPLFDTRGLHTELPTKKDMIRVIKVLCDVDVASHPMMSYGAFVCKPLALPSWKEAAALSAAVENARMRALKQRQASGVITEINLGKIDCHSQSEDGELSSDQQLLLVDHDDKQRSFLLKVRGSFREGCVQLSLSCVNDRHYHGSNGYFAVDICAVHTDIILRFRDVAVRPDGRWTKALGLCALTSKNARMTPHSRRVIPCTIGIRRMLSNEEVCPSTRLVLKHPRQLLTVNALGLEA